jgi:hypothetical protein
MTQRNPTLLAQFYEIAHGKTDPDEILDIAKGIFGSLNGYEDDIIAFTENSGMPIEQGLTELKEQTTAIKKQRETERQKLQATENVKRAIEASQKYQENLNNGVSSKDAHMKTLAGEIEKAAATLESPEEKDRFGTWKEYVYDCQTYDSSKDFRPSLFNDIAFPDGTVSYIGARTGRGKTTAMINLAREVMTTDTSRKVLFITLEMSRKQLLNKLILSTAYDLAIEMNTEHLLAERETPIIDLYQIFKDIPIGDTGAKEIVQHITKALKIIENAYNKTLMIYDGRGASLSAILNTIHSYSEQGTLVLLDYIQRMPDAGNITDTYMRVKRISDAVVNTAVKTNAIIISGAQFNRMSMKDTGGDDSFTDASYRESGDLEQDAHNAVGLGWKADRQSRFIEILKTREDKGAGYKYDIEFNGAYSYMAALEDIEEEKEIEEEPLFSFHEEIVKVEPPKIPEKIAKPKKGKTPVEIPPIHPLTGLPFYKQPKLRKTDRINEFTGLPEWEEVPE